MKIKDKTPADVGVIVGRFQVHEMHEAHRALVETVRSKHDRVTVFIGLSPLRNTIRNPLDFNARKRMFQETYPDIDVYYVEDTRDDELWSKNLDREIRKWISPHQTVMLYGSRDSFIDHYHGTFQTTELESSAYISGTEIRRRIANSFQPTPDYRAGVIAASFQRYPVCYPTVDVAVVDDDNKRLLLGQKRGEKELRFIGGFTDVLEDESYEGAACREVTEETGVEVGPPIYLGSALIDDWRYRGEIDKIMTLFFIAPYVFGRPEGADDLMMAQWVSLDDFCNGKIAIIKEHQVLAEMLKKHVQYHSSKI